MNTEAAVPDLEAAPFPVPVLGAPPTRIVPDPAGGGGIESIVGESPSGRVPSSAYPLILTGLDHMTVIAIGIGIVKRTEIGTRAVATTEMVTTIVATDTTERGTEIGTEIGTGIGTEIIE